MSVDMRTRPISAAGPVDPDSFFEVDWREAIARNGRRAASDAARLALGPLTMQDRWSCLDDHPPRRHHRRRTWRRFRSTRASYSIAPRSLTFFASDARQWDSSSEDGSVGIQPLTRLFCGWDPVLRSLLDGRPVYQSGDVTLQSLDGSPLELDQRFRLGEQTAEAAHFLAETGFLLLRRFFTDAEMDEVDADLARAVDSAGIDDGTSWWATTRDGQRYPCRILDFASKSPALQDTSRGPPLYGHRRDARRWSQAGRSVW